VQKISIRIIKYKPKMKDTENKHSTFQIADKSFQGKQDPNVTLNVGRWTKDEHLQFIRGI
jgi:hypothetical protein